MSTKRSNQLSYAPKFRTCIVSESVALTNQIALKLHYTFCRNSNAYSCKLVRTLSRCCIRVNHAAKLWCAPRQSRSALANPLARIPALILDDQTCVFDSPVIAEYVDSLNDTPILIPRDNALERMRIKRWEALADGVMDSAVLVRNEVLRDADKQDAASITRHNLAITRALVYMSEQMAAHNYCAGEAISLADLALVSALIYWIYAKPNAIGAARTTT